MVRHRDKRLFFMFVKYYGNECCDDVLWLVDLGFERRTCGQLNGTEDLMVYWFSMTGFDYIFIFPFQKSP